MNAVLVGLSASLIVHQMQDSVLLQASALRRGHANLSDVEK